MKLQISAPHLQVHVLDIHSGCVSPPKEERRLTPLPEASQRISCRAIATQIYPSLETTSEMGKSRYGLGRHAFQSTMGYLVVSVVNYAKWLHVLNTRCFESFDIVSSPFFNASLAI